MLVGFLLLLSGTLIGAGAALVLRDWVQRKRLSFLSARPMAARATHGDEAEITIERTSSLKTARIMGSVRTVTHAAAPRDASVTTVPVRVDLEARRVLPVASAPQPRFFPLELRSEPAAPVVPYIADADKNAVVTMLPSADPATLWSQLHGRVVRAMERVHAQPSARGIEIVAGRRPLGRVDDDEAGATFSVLLAGQKEAWLRFAVDGEGHLEARTTMLTEQVPPGSDHEWRLAPEQQTDADIDRLVGECLAPLLARAAARAVRPRVRVAANIAPDPWPVLQAGEAAAESESESDSQLASEQAWAETAGTLNAALRATNGAFAQVATRLLEIGQPQWDPVHHRHRQTLALVVAGEDAARVHVDRLAHEFEISVVGVDASGTETGARELARRRRVPTDGITVQALAELVAGCVWPTIARVRDRSNPIRP